MKAIVLVGGYSTRFYPYNTKGHKTMFEIMGKPIFFYTLEGLKKVGIKEIILRVSEDGVVKNYFGDGSKFGLSIEYIEQKESLGMGDVLLKAEKFLDGDFILIGGNHVNSSELVEELISSRVSGSKGVVLVRERENPWEYGIVEIKDGKLERIVEKPEKGKEPSNLGLVSAFLLPLDIIDFVKRVRLSEFNFEQEVLEEYAKSNFLNVFETHREILTLKYPWDILNTKNYLMKNLKESIDKSAEIAKSAEIEGEVVIESGAQVMEGAKIKGPCYIGKNVKVGTNALVRNGSDLEEDVRVGAFTEIKNSILGKSTTIHSGFVGDSIIGSLCKIGSGFTTANTKIDRENIEVEVKGVKVDTGVSRFGVIIGDNVKIGIKVSTMPGVIIGNDSLIGPSTSIFKNVASDTKYYTKFQEIVEKN